MDELISKYVKIPVRQRLGAFALLVGMLLGGYWYLVYAEQASLLEQLHAQYAKLENERAEKQAYAQNLAKYEARLKELQLSLTSARAQLPDDPDVPQLLAQLGNKARQAGLEIDRFEPKGEAAKDFYAEIAFDMKVHGSYHEVGTFVDSLGKLDRILNVTGLAMQQPRTVNQKVIVDGGFMIKTFRFLDQGDKKK